jgi:hypothetical protein
MRRARLRKEVHEVGVEDLIATKRRERSGVRGHSHAESDGPSRPRPEGDDALGNVRGGLSWIHAQLEHEMVPRVERRLLHANYPARVASDRADSWLQAGAELLDARRVEERQLPLLLGGSESRETRDEPHELALLEWWRPERLEVTALVLKVALHAHGAEQKESYGETRRAGRERVLDGASVG